MDDNLLDEDLAQQLQQLENINNDNQPQQHQQPQQPLQPQMLVTQAQSLLKIWKFTCVFFIVYFVPVIISIIAVLSVNWNSGCSSPLRIWLLVLGITHFLQAILSVVQLIGLPKLADSVFMQEMKIREVFKYYVANRVLDFWWFMWFVFGVAWTFTDSCSAAAPHIWKLSLALFVLQLVVLCVVIFCVCVSCVRVFSELSSLGLEPQQGASQADIDKLKVEKFTDLKSEMKKEDAVCAICLCEYESDEDIRFLPCNHHYHKDCINPWLLKNDSCPYCKKHLDGKPGKVNPVNV